MKIPPHPSLNLSREVGCTPGQGATFTVRLPRETSLSTLPESGSELLLKDLRIALLCADETSREVLKSALESSGAAVSAASHMSGTPHLASDVDVIATYTPNGQKLLLQDLADGTTCQHREANRALHGGGGSLARLSADESIALRYWLHPFRVSSKPSNSREAFAPARVSRR